MSDAGGSIEHPPWSTEVPNPVYLEYQGLMKKTLSRRPPVLFLGGTLAVVATLLGLWGLYCLARSPTTQLFGQIVSRVETTDRLVALTFDDGPNAALVDDVLHMLQRLEVRATFFVTGAELAETPGAGRRLVEAGHELGNHSYSHSRMVFVSPTFVRREIEDTDALIRRAGQAGEIYFRPPYCKKLVVLPWFLRQTGRTSVTWDLAPDSGSPQIRPETIVELVLDHVRPGSIILLHVWYNSRATSRRAVPRLVEKLRAKGYRFVTVGELLAQREA
ncbi:MAG: polysaccharide deacetylase family protein [Anaerolineae bacterium]